LVPKVKLNINSVEVHPQLSNNGHPMDGVLVGAGGCWFTVALLIPPKEKQRLETNLEIALQI
jgi:hypothetical protein